MKKAELLDCAKQPTERMRGTSTKTPSWLWTDTAEMAAAEMAVAESSGDQQGRARSQEQPPGAQHCPPDLLTAAQLILHESSAAQTPKHAGFGTTLIL